MQIEKNQFSLDVFHFWNKYSSEMVDKHKIKLKFLKNKHILNIIFTYIYII